jgi:hypothetical protein
MRPLVALLIVVALGAAWGTTSSVGASVTVKNTKAEQKFIDVLPSDVGRCVGSTAHFKKSYAKQGKAYAKGLVVAVDCSGTSDQGAPAGIVYQKFKNEKSLKALFSALLGANNLQPGENANASTCPKENAYHIGSNPTISTGLYHLDGPPTDPGGHGEYGCVPSTSSGPAYLIWTVPTASQDVLEVTGATNDPDGSTLLKWFFNEQVGSDTLS